MIQVYYINWYKFHNDRSFIFGKKIFVYYKISIRNKHKNKNNKNKKNEIKIKIMQIKIRTYKITK